MANKRTKPEETFTKLRQAEVLTGRAMLRLDAIRKIGVTEQTHYRWSAGRNTKGPSAHFPAKQVSRNGLGPIEGTEAAAERERAAEKGCV